MRPVPWFWITRVAVSTAAVIAWGIAYPRTPFWELILVCMAVIAGMEGLRYGYRREQRDIRRRQAGVALPEDREAPPGPLQHEGVWTSRGR